MSLPAQWQILVSEERGWGSETFEVHRKEPRRTEDGEKDGDVAVKAMNDAVLTDDKFADVRTIKVRN